MPEWKPEIVRRLAPLNLAPAREAEIAEELAQHLEDRYQELLASGNADDQAFRITIEELKDDHLFARSLESVEKEKYREPFAQEDATRSFLAGVVQDVRYALRTLRKSPGFTTVAVLTLALGIGANTAIFSVVEGVLLSQLPYPQADRLVMVWENNPRFPRVWVSYPNFLDWQRTAHSFQQMAALMEKGADLTNPGAPLHVADDEISSGFFITLDARLAIGREFTLDENRVGAAPVAIISHRLWLTLFNGSPKALGQSMTLDGVNYTVIGVAPQGFHLEGEADVYTPLGTSDPAILNNRGAHAGIFSFARLKPGVALSQAQAEMNTIQSGLDRLYPDDNRDLGIYLEPLKQAIIGNVGGMLLLVLGAVGVVVLIACANVANLLLTRCAARTREFALRAALGARHSRLVRQSLTESVLLSVLGAILGLAFAKSGLNILGSMIQTLPRSQEIALSLPVLLFTLAVSVAVGLLFGLAPAIRATTLDLQTSLKEGSRGSTPGHQRAQSTLAIVQIALTLTLLAGAGLLFRTIQQLWGVNPGFDIEDVLTFKVGVSSSLTNTASGTRTAYRQLIERIHQIPGVQAVDLTDALPLSGQAGTTPFWINSHKPASIQAAPRVVLAAVGPDYLRVMGIPLLRGRFFTSGDTTDSPCVMVVDSALARTYFPGRDPVGQTMSAGFSPVGPCRIAGVVGHVREWELNEPSTFIQNQAYFPIFQDPDQWVHVQFSYATLIVRSHLDASSLIPAIEAAVYTKGNAQTIYDVGTMRDIASESMSTQRFPMILLGAFAGLALLLASIGIYGVISYSVAQRIHEIGIRMALGATKNDVFRMVIGQGLRLAFVGLAIGGIAGVLLSHSLSSFSDLLYGVRASDPLTFVAVSLVIIAVAVLACYVPARRATRVDPMVALRYE